METLPEFLREFATIHENKIIINLNPKFQYIESLILSSQIPLIFQNSDIDNNENKPIFGNIQILCGNITFSNMKFVNFIETPKNSDNEILLTFDNCSFTSDHKQKASIITTKNVKLNIQNCFFENINFIAILSYGSNILINNCTFCNINKSAIIFTKNATAKVKSSKFANIVISAVFLYKSTVEFDQCFIASTGQRTISLSHSSAICKNTTLYNLKHHGIHLTQSEFKGENLKLSQISLSAIYIQNNSKCTLSNSLFEQMPGNGIVLDNSSLTVNKCIFNDIKGPVSTIVGVDQTSATFLNSNIINCKSHAFICKDSSIPVFDHLAISNVDGNCFSLSNFSRASIKHCLIINCKGTAFSVFNGAKHLIDKNRIIQTKFIDIFAGGDPFVINNFISLDPTTSKTIQIHHNGIGTFSNNFQITRSKPLPFDIINNNPVFSNNLTQLQKQQILDEKKLFQNYLDQCQMNWKDFVALFDSKTTSLFGYKPPLCEICKQNLSSIILSPCGHLILCENCLKTQTVCPLCNLPISNAVPLSKALENSTEKCKKDGIKQSNCICFQCNHSCTCYTCEFEQRLKFAHTCSQCNAKTLAVTPIFPLT